MTKNQSPLDTYFLVQCDRRCRAFLLFQSERRVIGTSLFDLRASSFITYHLFGPVLLSKRLGCWNCFFFKRAKGTAILVRPAKHNNGTSGLDAACQDQTKRIRQEVGVSPKYRGPPLPFPATLIPQFLRFTTTLPVPHSLRLFLTQLRSSFSSTSDLFIFRIYTVCTRENTHNQIS